MRPTNRIRGGKKRIKNHEEAMNRTINYKSLRLRERKKDMEVGDDSPPAGMSARAAAQRRMLRVRAVLKLWERGILEKTLDDLERIR